MHFSDVGEFAFSDVFQFIGSVTSLLLAIICHSFAWYCNVVQFLCPHSLKSVDGVADGRWRLFALVRRGRTFRVHRIDLRAVQVVARRCP